MVKTKSVKDPVEEADGKRILVMRGWARPYSKVGLQVAGEGQCRRDLAPSRQLLDDWNNRKVTGLTWEVYVSRYTKEMASQQDAIAALAEEARNSTITLLCQEEEGDLHCHRHLLKKMIEDAMKA
jgi:uncharacterized protein YeaO (DUF488 family)